jgi:Flavodoxins
MKTLIAYFSAQGTTAKVAQELSEAIRADIFEIRPEKPYTAADIRWTNPLARCNREKFGGKDVTVVGRIESFADYDTVLIGFPIWYGGAPNVVNTFCKGYDWRGKRVLAFATSGGSGIGKTAEKLKPYVQGAASVDAKLVHSAAEVKNWVESL